MSTGDELEFQIQLARSLALSKTVVDRWRLGDLLNQMNRKYGEATIENVAHEIGGLKRNTLYDFARVAEFYSEELRYKYRQLSWSHYRSAMATKSLDEALKWLEKAAIGDNNEAWSVGRLDNELRIAGKTGKVRNHSTAQNTVDRQIGLRLSYLFDNSQIVELKGKKSLRWSVNTDRALDLPLEGALICLRSTTQGGWCAEIYLEYANNLMILAKVESDTPALAICFAWIEWFDQQFPEFDFDRPPRK